MASAELCNDNYRRLEPSPKMTCCRTGGETQPTQPENPLTPPPSRALFVLQHTTCHSQRKNFSAQFLAEDITKDRRTLLCIVLSCGPHFFTCGFIWQHIRCKKKKHICLRMEVASLAWAQPLRGMSGRHAWRNNLAENQGADHINTKLQGPVSVIMYLALPLPGR